MRITTHPGEKLREEFLAPLGMSANALARALNLDAPRINDVVRERRGITADTALRLGRYFGTTPEFWTNLQTSHELSKALAKAKEAIQAIQPREHVA
ncbi:MAG: HigA family addiction module antitoxin [Deltaproteobacteria bacterium]|nr:HigA family addiction module antitoxin [Deltaproteobacteria bacterium]